MMISPGCRPPGMGPVYGITWGREWVTVKQLTDSVLPKMRGAQMQRLVHCEEYRVSRRQSRPCLDTHTGNTHTLTTHTLFFTAAVWATGGWPLISARWHHTAAGGDHDNNNDGNKPLTGFRTVCFAFATDIEPLVSDHHMRLRGATTGCAGSAADRSGQRLSCATQGRWQWASSLHQRLIPRACARAPTWSSADADQK